MGLISITVSKECVHIEQHHSQVFEEVDDNSRERKVHIGVGPVKLPFIKEVGTAV